MKIQKYILFTITFITGCYCWYPYYCPEEFNCANVYTGPFAVPLCEYYCCIGPMWLSGFYGDGTPCWNLWTPLLHGFTGTCLRGTCMPRQEVPAPTKRFPLRPTREPRLPNCDGYYRGLGYATNCTYTCYRRRGYQENANYRNGTPCINITKGVPQGKPGLCQDGNCVELENLPPGYNVRRAFKSVYNQCPLKWHSQQTPLTDCNHYCQFKGEWFFGNYTENSKCHINNTDGWCCRGGCNELPWCQEQYTIPPPVIFPWFFE